MSSLDHLKIISLILSSKLYKNLKPVFKIFLFDKENPKLGISSLVSFKVIFGLYFLQISATSFTVTVSLVKLNISEEISSLYKMPKKIKMTVNEGTDYTINYFWAFDYINTEYRQTGTAILNTLVSSGAQWGTSEWNLGEWSGDATAVDSVPAQLSGSGQNLQYGFDVTVNGSNIAIQQIQ